MFEAGQIFFYNKVSKIILTYFQLANANKANLDNQSCLTKEIARVRYLFVRPNEHSIEPEGESVYII